MQISRCVFCITHQILACATDTLFLWNSPGLYRQLKEPGPAAWQANQIQAKIILGTQLLNTRY